MQTWHLVALFFIIFFAVAGAGVAVDDYKRRKDWQYMQAMLNQNNANPSFNFGFNY